MWGSCWSLCGFPSLAPLIRVCVCLQEVVLSLRIMPYSNLYNSTQKKYRKHDLKNYHSTRESCTTQRVTRAYDRGGCLYTHKTPPPTTRGRGTNPQQQMPPTRTHLPVTIANARVIHRAGSVSRARVGTATSLRRGHVESAQQGSYAERGQHPSIRSHFFSRNLPTTYCSSCVAQQASTTRAGRGAWGAGAGRGRAQREQGALGYRKDEARRYDEEHRI